MIKLNATENNVEVRIEGNAVDISRELNALLKSIKDDKQLREAFTVALIVGDISEEESEESEENIDDPDSMEDFIKKMFGGNGNENFMS
jgi:hypothetical protein